MSALQHQIAASVMHEPASWLGGVVELNAVEKALTPRLAQFHQHRQVSSAMGTERSEKPQTSKATTEQRVNHSGT